MIELADFSHTSIHKISDHINTELLTRFMQAQLADAVREYQANLNKFDCDQKDGSQEDLRAAYDFQKALRQMSLLCTFIQESKIDDLKLFLLSGNMDTVTEHRSCFSSAFSNMNFVTMMPNFLNFLRVNPDYFAKIMYKYIDTVNRATAEHIGFSTIPGLFQNGWCSEEDELWSDFLSCYLNEFFNQKSISCLSESPHFALFKGFFIEKLCLDYLQISLFSDLEKLNFDPSVKEKRVKFTFDGGNLLPLLYIKQIEAAAKSILQKLKINMHRIPMSVRKLLRQVSTNALRINTEELSGIRLASIFFIEGALRPIIRRPYMIGLEMRDSNVFEDIANLLFFSHSMGITHPPPFALILYNQLDTSNFIIDSVMEDLINSVKFMSSYNEFHESIFIQIFPGYRKLVSFLPIDLFYIHSAAYKYNKSANRKYIESVSVFDFLLKLPPEIDRNSRYEVMTLDLKIPEVANEIELPEPLAIPCALCDSFKNVLCEMPAVLLERTSPKALVEYMMHRENNNRFIAVLNKVYDKIDIFERFVERENKCFEILKASRLELIVSAKLEQNELRDQLQRSLSLNSSLLCTTYKLMINAVFQGSLSHDLSIFDNEVHKCCSNRQFLLEIVVRILTKTFKCLGIENKRFAQLEKTVFCMLIDRIKLDDFMAVNPGTASNVSKLTVDGDNRHILHNSYLRITQELHGTRILEKGVEVLISALSFDSFATMFHFVLKTTQTILSAIETDDNDLKAEVIKWIIHHSNVELLASWYCFTKYFFPNHRLLTDIVGCLDTQYYTLFAQVLGSLLDEK